MPPPADREAGDYELRENGGRRGRTRAPSPRCLFVRYYFFGASNADNLSGSHGHTIVVDGGAWGIFLSESSPNNNWRRGGFSEKAWRAVSCLAKGVQVCELELPNLDPGMMSSMMSRDKSSPGTRSWVGTNTKVFNPVGFLILHDKLLRMKNRNENSKIPKPDYDHSF